MFFCGGTSGDATKNAGRFISGPVNCDQIDCAHCETGGTICTSPYFNLPAGAKPSDPVPQSLCNVWYGSTKGGCPAANLKEFLDMMELGMQNDKVWPAKGAYNKLVPKPPDAYADLTT